MRIACLLIALLPLVAQGQTAEIAAAVTDDKGRPLADAVVVAVPRDGSLRAASAPREAVVDQIDKEFMPKVMAVLVGASVRFPNNDNVRHQVYSFSPAKRFELPLYAGVPAQPVVFDKAGVVVLGCNIHDWMIGYVYVSESPYFAKTGPDGKALLSELPPKEYMVRVWHPQLRAAEDTTRKTADVSRALRAEIEWSLALKSEAKPRRAPTAERSGKY